MRIEKVTPENVTAACRLAVRPEQEDYVAPVAISLAEAYADPGSAWPRLIYDRDQLVAFVMGGFDPDSPVGWRCCGSRANMGRKASTCVWGSAPPARCTAGRPSASCSCRLCQTQQVTEDQRPAGPGRRLHALAVELAAMAQNGLTYATDRYDRARYERLRTVAAEVLGMLDEADTADLRSVLAAEAGHATPKVDVRGALFDDAGRVLLVQEKRDGKWTLPGGWADAMDSPSTAVVREVAEESGLTVQVSRLAAVQDGSRHNGHGASPFHIYKLFFLVERLDPTQQPTAGLDEETTDVGFFARSEIPELSTRRTTFDQLRVMWTHHADASLPTIFD